jgi:hypothetical protein
MKQKTPQTLSPTQGAASRFRHAAFEPGYRIQAKVDENSSNDGEITTSDLVIPPDYDRPLPISTSSTIPQLSIASSPGSGSVRTSASTACADTRLQGP